MTAHDDDTITVSSLFDLTGKIALVTGGSRGIGRMITEGYLQAGATVYISSRHATVCDQVAAELSAVGPCHALPADIARDDDRARLVAALGDRTDRLDILVNNAGTAWGADYVEFPERGFRKVLELDAVHRAYVDDAGRGGRASRLREQPTVLQTGTPLLGKQGGGAS